MAKQKAKIKESESLHPEKCPNCSGGSWTVIADTNNKQHKCLNCGYTYSKE